MSAILQGMWRMALRKRVLRSSLVLPRPNQRGQWRRICRVGHLGMMDQAGAQEMIHFARRLAKDAERTRSDAKLRNEMSTI